MIPFAYDDSWLENADTSLIFDPDLMLYKGRQYVPLNKSMFGIFADSCPDRWGRTLMKRREAKINRKNLRLIFHVFTSIISVIRLKRRKNVCVKRERRSLKKQLQIHF